MLDLTGTNPDMLTNPDLLHKGAGGKGSKVCYYSYIDHMISYIMYFMMLCLFHTQRKTGVLKHHTQVKFEKAEVHVNVVYYNKRLD